MRGSQNSGQLRREQREGPGKVCPPAGVGVEFRDRLSRKNLNPSTQGSEPRCPPGRVCQGARRIRGSPGRRAPLPCPADTFFRSPPGHRAAEWLSEEPQHHQKPPASLHRLLLLPTPRQRPRRRRASARVSRPHPHEVSPWRVDGGRPRPSLTTSRCPWAADRGRVTGLSGHTAVPPHRASPQQARSPLRGTREKRALFILGTRSWGRPHSPRPSVLTAEDTEGPFPALPWAPTPTPRSWQLRLGGRRAARAARLQGSSRIPETNR